MKCFKCEKPLDSLAPSDFVNSWDMPNDAVLFDGGLNYGSTLYDALIDGIQVEIVVCDECVTKGKEDGTLREYKLYGNKKAHDFVRETWD